MKAWRQVNLHLKDDEFALLDRFAARIGKPRASAARDLRMAVLTDDAAAHASDDERPARDVRGDLEGTAA